MDVPAAVALLTAFAVPLALGAGLGLAGGIFGIGGGIIAIPVMTAVFGMDQKLAQGTALVMMVPNLSIALWRYSQRQPLPKRRTALLMLCSVAAATVTARYASSLASNELRRYFGFFLLWLAGHSLWRLYGKKHEAPAGRCALPESLIPLVGLIGGACQGLISIGGGMIAPPILVTFFRQGQALSQGLGMALVTPSSVIALLTFSSAGHVDWKMGALLALGGATTVSAGVRIAHRLPERRLRTAFSLMLLATATWMIVSAGRS